MFNRLASTLGHVIWLDLVFAWAKFSQCNVASHLVISIPIDEVHMSWRHSKSRDVVGHHNSLGYAIENGPACRSFGFYRGIGPPVPMPTHLRISYRIASVCSNFQHVGWGAIPAHPCRPVLSFQNPFRRKLPETLVSARSPTLWHAYVPQGSLLRSQGLGGGGELTPWYPSSTFWAIFNLSGIDMILVNGHTVSCIVRPVSDWHQTWQTFIFHMDGLNSRIACPNSFWNPNFRG